MSCWVRVGFCAPLSGDQAVVGIPMAQVAAMAICEFNAQDILPYPVELVTVDDQASEAGAVRVSRGLIGDPHLVAVVGHKNTGPCLKAGEHYEQAGVPYLTPSATGVSLGQRGHSTFFRLCCHDRAQGELAGEFVSRQLQASGTLVVHDGTGYGQSLARAFGESLGQRSQIRVWDLEVEEGHREYPQVTKALDRTGANVVYLALTEIEAAVVASQLRQARYRVHLVGADGSPYSKFPELAQEAADGAYMTYAGFDGEETPGGRAFIARYRERYCEEPPVYALEVYDAVTAVFRGLSALGEGDPPQRRLLPHKIRELGTWEGLSGRVEFDQRGERLGIKPTMWVVRGDKPVRWWEPA